MRVARCPDCPCDSARCSSFGIFGDTSPRIWQSDKSLAHTHTPLTRSGPSLVSFERFPNTFPSLSYPSLNGRSKSRLVNQPFPHPFSLGVDVHALSPLHATPSSYPPQPWQHPVMWLIRPPCTMLPRWRRPRLMTRLRLHCTPRQDRLRLFAPRLRMAGWKTRMSKAKRASCPTTQQPRPAGLLRVRVSPPHSENRKRLQSPSLDHRLRQVEDQRHRALRVMPLLRPRGLPVHRFHPWHWPCPAPPLPLGLNTLTGR